MNHSGFRAAGAVCWIRNITADANLSAMNYMVFNKMIALREACLRNAVRYICDIVIILITSLLLSVNNLASASADAGDTKALLLQMSSVINSRNPKKIAAFFNYYTSDTAKFTKQSSVLDPSDHTIIRRQETITLNKEEYIRYLTHIATEPEQYAFWLDQEGFSMSVDDEYAVVNAVIREVEIVDSTKTKRPKDKIYVKLVVSTNCNLSFNIQSSPPILAGANCIEKIIIQ